MASPNEFIVQFEQSMKKLNDARANVQIAIQSKEEFNVSLQKNLVDINDKLKNIADKISMLKNRADSLQGQVDGNNKSISEKTKEMETIQRQIAELQSEKEAVISQANNEKQTLTQKINDQQQLIDQKEDALRTINNQLQEITNEREALKNELNSRGDKDQLHAAELERMSNENQGKLAQQQQELTQKINECDAKIQDYERKIQENESAISTAQQNTQNTISELTAQLEKANQEKQDLTSLNNELIDKIRSATGAISEAADELVRLSNAAPNLRTKADVDQIVREVNDSIQQISNALSRGPELNPLVPIKVNNFVFTYDQIRSRLAEKAKQRRTNPRVSEDYGKALDEVRSAQTPEEVADALIKYQIPMTANGISGGRRTKKIRKQKGGFTYKSTSRRRSISSTPKSSRRSRRSSR
jgi:chromosome segregation ATPase